MLVLAAVSAYGQDMKEATEKAKEASATFNAGNFEEALTGFRAALELANACGDEGLTLSMSCQEGIAKASYFIAKQAFEDGNFDEAVAKAEEASKVASEFGLDEYVGKNESVISNAYTKKAGALMNEKKFDDAAQIYKKLLEINPANGPASLNLVRAYLNSGNLDSAKEALEIAKANGKEAEATKLIGTSFLKRASISLKEKKYAAAIEDAKEANLYNENAKAYLIIGQASASLGKDNDAIANLEKYLELTPTAGNAGAISLTIGALYHKAGNKAKAAEYYKKASADPNPQVKDNALKQLQALK